MASRCDPTGVGGGALDRHGCNGLKALTYRMASRADMGRGPSLCRWEPMPTTRVIGVRIESGILSPPPTRVASNPPDAIPTRITRAFL